MCRCNDFVFCLNRRDTTAAQSRDHHKRRTFCEVEFAAGVYSVVDRDLGRKAADVPIRNLKSPLRTPHLSPRRRVHLGENCLAIFHSFGEKIHLHCRPSRVSHAAPPPKAEAAPASQAGGSAKAAPVRSQDDVKQTQKSPVFARSSGPALVDASSEKYTLMPESLRRKIACNCPCIRLLHLLIILGICSYGISEAPNISAAISCSACYHCICPPSNSNQRQRFGSTTNSQSRLRL